MLERCNAWIRSTLILGVAVAFGGCSKPGGFYVVPQHKDLGVNKNGSAIAEFEIVNGLDLPVEIKHIYPSCKCTTVELNKNPIPSGESAILRATADLTQQAGKQQFSVVFVTDNPGFPNRRVSFDALVPATGTRQRRLTIGSFYPGAKLDLELPASSFARGSVEQVTG